MRIRRTSCWTFRHSWIGFGRSGSRMSTVTGSGANWRCSSDGRTVRNAPIDSPRPHRYESWPLVVEFPDRQIPARMVVGDAAGHAKEGRGATLTLLENDPLRQQHARIGLRAADRILDRSAFDLDVTVAF